LFKLKPGQLRQDFTREKMLQKQMIKWITVSQHYLHMLLILLHTMGPLHLRASFS